MSAAAAEREQMRKHTGWHDEQPCNASSRAFENLRHVAGGNARLFGFQGYSSDVATQFILVFDQDFTPGAGDIPVFPIPVAAASSFSWYGGPMGRWFSQGIWLANSSTANLLTIGAADCWFDAQCV